MYAMNNLGNQQYVNPNGMNMNG